MAGSERGAGLARVAFMLAGTALATGCQTLAGMTAQAQSFGLGGGSSCASAPSGAVSVGAVSAAEAQRLQAVVADCRVAAGRTDSIRQRSTLLYRSGRANIALDDYYRASRQAPPDGYGLAGAARDLELVVANTAYDAPSAGKSQREASLGSQARLELARVYQMQKRYTDAITTLESMLKTTPNDAAARLAIARVYAERSPRGGLSDGSLEKAVSYLDIFTTDLKGVDPGLVQAGRQELIERATSLGLALMEGPPTRESSQRAIDAFAKAEAAAVAPGASMPGATVSGIHTKLGQARLRMAGLPQNETSTTFECAAPADSYWLVQASASFATAWDKSPTAEAAAGRGCALQAIVYQSGGSPAEAVPWFERATQLADGNIGYWLSLASVRDASGIDARSAFQKALSLASGDNAQEAHIYSQISKIYLNKARDPAEADPRAQLAQARANAEAALKADARSGAAHLMLGKALFEERKASPQIALSAKSHLTQAIALTALSAGQQGLRADALYHRSRLEMEPVTRDAGQSVRDAVAALTTVDRPDYREQACLSHVRFMSAGLVADGKIRCAPEEIPADPKATAKSYLLEGMFYLSTTRVRLGQPQDLGWERALQSFEKGADRLGDPSPGEDPPTKELRAKLTVGQAISYGCVGLKDRARETVRGVLDKAYQDGADAYFVEYDLKECKYR